MALVVVEARMTTTAKSDTVVDFEAVGRKVAEQADMMGNKLTTNLSADLASVLVSFKGSYAPVSIFIALPKFHAFRRYASFPGWVVRAVTNRIIRIHCLSNVLTILFGHLFALVPWLVSWLELARVCATWKLTVFQSEVRAALELGCDFLTDLWALFALPVSSVIAADLAFRFLSMFERSAIHRMVLTLHLLTAEDSSTFDTACQLFSTIRHEYLVADRTVLLDAGSVTHRPVFIERHPVFVFEMFPGDRLKLFTADSALDHRASIVP